MMTTSAYLMVNSGTWWFSNNGYEWLTMDIQWVYNMVIADHGCLMVMWMGYTYIYIYTVHIWDICICLIPITVVVVDSGG